jgi:hypothetical protein
MLSRLSGATGLAIWLLPAAAWAVDAAKDLTAVIALHGKPCGTVVRFTKQAENDYVASCSSGHVYRVFVDWRGRVVVAEHEGAGQPRGSER